MSTSPHPLLAQWLREAGAPAKSASGWQATQARLDGLAQGLDGLPLFSTSPWQVLDQLPWAGSATPTRAPGAGVAARAGATSTATATAVDQAQARLQAVLQVLTPLTAARGGAVATAPPGSMAAAAGAPARRWAPLAAGGVRGVATGTAQPDGPGEVRGAGQAAVQGAAQGQAPSGGHGATRRAARAAAGAPHIGQPVRPPTPPTPPTGPAFSPISAAAAAAHWLDRATRAGLNTAFYSPLGLSVQASLAAPAAGGQADNAARSRANSQAGGQAGPMPERAGGGAWQLPFTHVPTLADLAKMAQNLPRSAAPEGRAGGPFSGSGSDSDYGWPHSWVHAVKQSFAAPPPAGGGLFSGDGPAGLFRRMAEQQRAAAWVGEDEPGPNGVDAHSGGWSTTADMARRLAEGVRGHNAARAQAPTQVRAGAVAAWHAPVAGMAHTALDALAQGLGSGGQMTGMTGMTGLRGLAQRAMQASGPAHHGSGAHAAGRAGVSAAGGHGTAPAAAMSDHRPGSRSGSGRGTAAAPSAPPDDQQLLQQLARVLRREAQRDGINLSDTAP